METRKSLLAIAVAMGLGLSGAAFADQGGDGNPNTNSDDGSIAANVTDNLNDNSDNTNNSDNSVNDAFKIANSGNDGSDNSDNSSTDLDLNVFLNEADLDGSVSGVATSYNVDGRRGGMASVATHNEISGGSANFTGVGAFAQNAGDGSVTQANVSVMSNLSTAGN